MARPVFSAFLTASLVLAFCVTGFSQTFFFSGGVDNDFFNEANWTVNSDGTGGIIGSDLLIDSATNAIGLDLIVDGDNVVANGQVDFGTGSLTLLNGSAFSVTAIDADLDINAGSTFAMTNSTLVVEDIANFEGTSSFVGGTVTSITDDIAFQDNFVNLSIDGTSFTAFDNIYFDGFSGSITDATFNSGDRLGVRNSVGIVMTDTDINVNGGTGDVDDIFAAAGSGSSLTLLGSSTLLADSVEEGANLILDGSTIATMGASGERIQADGSTITINSSDVVLNTTLIVDDARDFLINGTTGLAYSADSSTWNVTNWNGVDAVSLQINAVPEPNTLLFGLAIFSAVAMRRRR